MKRKREDKKKEKCEFEEEEEVKLVFGRIDPDMIDNSLFYLDPSTKSVKRLQIPVDSRIPASNLKNIETDKNRYNLGTFFRD